MQHSEISKAESKGLRDIFQIAIGRVPKQNVRAIISQRNENVTQSISVEMSSDGKRRQIVVAPLRYQGYELVDDGITTKTYSPDDRIVTIQPSGRTLPVDARKLMALIDRNYDLRVEGHDRVAGRMAVIIAAVPKNGDLETRCYTIDEKTGYLLRLETCRDNGAKTLHFETKAVSFPSDFAEDTFQFDDSAPSITRHQKMEHRCVKPSESGKLRGELGFEPVMPQDLPNGFEIQELQTTATAAVPALAVRVTDGLAKATIYQWKNRNGGSNQIPEGTLVRSNGRMTFMISGDLSREVKESLIQAFVKGSRQERAEAIPDNVLSWVLELQGEAQTFTFGVDVY